MHVRASSIVRVRLQWQRKTLFQTNRCSTANLISCVNNL